MLYAARACSGVGVGVRVGLESGPGLNSVSALGSGSAEGSDSSERTVVPRLLNRKLECRPRRAFLMPAQLAPPIRASLDQLWCIYENSQKTKDPPPRIYAVYKHGMYTAASAAVCVVCATQPGAAHQPDEVVVPEVAGDHERRRRIREGRGAVDVCAPFKQDVSSSELVVKASVAQWRGVLMVEPVEPGARGEQQLHDPHVSASVQRRPAHPKEALRREPGGRAAAWWACCCLVGVPVGNLTSHWTSRIRHRRRRPAACPTRCRSLACSE